MVEAFLVGIGLGILMGIATCYLILSRPKNDDPPSWLELLDEQKEAALEGFGAASLRPPEPRVVTRLTNRERTITL